MGPEASIARGRGLPGGASPWHGGASRARDPGDVRACGRVWHGRIMTRLPREAPRSDASLGG